MESSRTIVRREMIASRTIETVFVIGNSNIRRDLNRGRGPVRRIIDTGSAQASSSSTASASIPSFSLRFRASLACRSASRCALAHASFAT